MLQEYDSTIIQFKDVGMRYGSGPEVLRNIDLDLKQGDFRFLTGTSGAGKSSLLRLLYLAHRPSRGTINMFGKDLTNATRQDLPLLRRRVGVVFQDFRLIEHLTSFENVALPLRITGKKPEEYSDDVVELLTWVGLGEHINTNPSSLSGGEQQRVAIARAVVAKPDLLLADEPTGNLDPDLGLRLMRLFLELNKLGTTIVIATHDEHMVGAIGAPEFHLDQGRLELRDDHGAPRPAPAQQTAKPEPDEHKEWPQKEPDKEEGEADE